jgi:N-acetylmuramoyl-L-alanine amidase/FlgD Ig-like domain
MRVICLSFLLFFAAPGAALASPLVARDLPVRSAAVETAAQSFDLVGMHWRGSGTIRFRTRSAAGKWSAWRVAAPESDDLPDANTPEGRRSRGWHLGNPYWVGPSSGIQYRATGNVQRLRGYFVHPLPGRRPSPRLVQPFDTDEPAIITRPRWGAYENIRRNRKHGPKIADNVHFAIVHHTAGSNSYSCSQSAAIVRSIEVYHVKGNGWDDIGYNFLVDKCGQVFEGRYGGTDRAVVGAHALGFNFGSVGVALIGNYNGAGLSSAARASLVKLLAWRLDVAHVDPLSRTSHVSTGNPKYGRGTSVQLNAIVGHRDTYPTSCPGNNVYAQLPSIRKAVAATGLPKIYSPIVFGAVGGNVGFTAKLSGSASWTVAVTDALGRVVGAGTGSGRAVDWTWDATTVPHGRYTYEIDATSGPASARPAVGTIGQAAPQLSVTQLRVEPAVVTPNGDGVGDSARISYVLGASAQVTVTLADGNGATLANLFAGPMTQGIHTFSWRDVTVPDGPYKLTIAAQSANGKQVASTVSFFVDRNLARVRAAPAVISPNGDGRFDTATVQMQLHSPSNLRVEIWRASRRLATLVTQTLPGGPFETTWDGRLGARKASDGSYDLVVTATDPVATVTQTVSVTVDTTPPRLRLVSRARMQFWSSEPGTVTAVYRGRRFVKAVKRGYFSIPALRRARGFTLTAADVVGNVSRTLRG